MRIFIKLLKWDLLLLVKYGILPVAIGIGAMYIALIYLFALPPQIIVFLIFSDPSMMGFVFIGVMVLSKASRYNLGASGYAFTTLAIHSIESNYTYNSCVTN